MMKVHSGEFNKSLGQFNMLHTNSVLNVFFREWSNQVFDSQSVISETK